MSRGKTMFSKEVFSRRLLVLRQQTGVTQAELAAAIKINRTSITLMERAERAASIEVLYALADFFDVSLDYLVGRSDDPTFRP